MIKNLRYGNTNTYFLKGTRGGLLIDTDYAGSLQGFFRKIKSEGITIRDISYVIVTHYHPDHMGIIGELQRLEVKLVIMDIQKDMVHFSDEIFSKEKYMNYIPVDESKATFRRTGIIC